MSFTEQVKGTDNFLSICISDYFHSEMFPQTFCSYSKVNYVQNLGSLETFKCTVNIIIPWCLFISLLFSSSFFPSVRHHTVCYLSTQLNHVFFIFYGVNKTDMAEIHFYCLHTLFDYILLSFLELHAIFMLKMFFFPSLQGTKS